MSRRSTNGVLLGIGLVTTRGVSLDQYWTAINDGQEFFQPSSYPGTAYDKCQVGQIHDFDPSIYYPLQLHGSADRSSLLLAAASKLALDDSRRESARTVLGSFGVVHGATFSIANTTLEYFCSVLLNGPRHCRIGQFPNTVMNAPGSRVAIFEGMRGPNITIASGMNTGIDSLGMALQCISGGGLETQAEQMVCGGAEAISMQLLAALAEKRMLARGVAGRNGVPNGLIPTEAAVALVVGRQQSPQREHYSEFVGYEGSFSSARRRQSSLRAHSVSRAILTALERAAINANDIGCVVISTAPDRYSQESVLRAVGAVFKDSLARLPVLAPHKLLGDSGAALGLECILVAQGFLTAKLSNAAMRRLNENTSWSGSAINSHLAAVVQIDPGGHNSVLLMARTSSERQ